MINTKERVAGVLIAVSSMAFPCIASAAFGMNGLHYDFSNGASADARLTLSYGLQMRTKNPAASIAGQSDGDGNFQAGDPTSNNVQALLQANVHKGVSGIVFSATDFYDFAYHKPPHNNGAARSTAGPLDQFPKHTRYFDGSYPRILDAYAYTTIDTGGATELTLKLGNQVVNWGQMNFFQDMASAQGPIDVVKANMPGAQTQTILLPERQLLASFQVTNDLTLLSYYQFGFHRSLLPGVGSYFSQSNLSGPSANCAFDFNHGTPGAVCGGGGYQGRNKVSQFGQYGLGGRYQASATTQVGLFYLHFDDRLPFPNITNPKTFAFTQENMTNEDLVGFTTSTFVPWKLPQWVGSFRVATETTYRWHGTVLKGSLGTPSNDGHIFTSGIDILDNLGNTPLAPLTTFIFEISGQYIDNIPTADLNFKTRTAGAFTSLLSLDYPGILPGWELAIPIEYQYQFNGRATFGPTVSGQYGGAYSVGATATWRTNLAFGLSYKGFTGGVDMRPRTNHALDDRDFMSFTVTYSF